MKLLVKISFILLLAFSAITLHSCKPDDEIGKTYGPYTFGEARNYIDFKPGSWWVYQNNKSGLFDTLVLKSISFSNKTFTGKNIIIKEMMNMLIYSATTKYEYKYYSGGANPDVNKESLSRQNLMTIIHGKSKPGDYNGETISFFFPFDSLSKRGLGVGETNYEGFQESISVKGKLYKNVRIFHQTQDPCLDGWTGKYYWAQDIGLIMKETVKKESWELVNYHVERP
jgi:hypothetical protein